MIHRQFSLFDKLLDLSPINQFQLSSTSFSYLNKLIFFSENTKSKFKIFISSQYSIHFINQILILYQAYISMLKNHSNTKMSTVKWKINQVIIIQILRYFLLI